MNRLCSLLLLIAAVPGCAAPHSPAGHGDSAGVFYVATDGNDSYSGRKPSPESKRSEGPFATLPRALRAVHDWKQQQGAADSATIFIRGGIYFLKEPLAISPGDS